MVKVKMDIMKWQAGSAGRWRGGWCQDDSADDGDADGRDAEDGGISSDEKEGDQEQQRREQQPLPDKADVDSDADVDARVAGAHARTGADGRAESEVEILQQALLVMDAELQRAKRRAAAARASARRERRRAEERSEEARRARHRQREAEARAERAERAAQDDGGGSLVERRERVSAHTYEGRGAGEADSESEGEPGALDVVRELQDALGELMEEVVSARAEAAAWRRAAEEAVNELEAARRAGAETGEQGTGAGAGGAGGVATAPTPAEQLERSRQLRREQLGTQRRAAEARLRRATMAKARAARLAAKQLPGALDGLQAPAASGHVAAALAARPPPPPPALVPVPLGERNGARVEFL
eukprot:g4390.t1